MNCSWEAFIQGKSVLSEIILKQFFREKRIWYHNGIETTVVMF